MTERLYPADDEVRSSGWSGAEQQIEPPNLGTPEGISISSSTQEGTGNRGGVLMRQQLIYWANSVNCPSWLERILRGIAGRFTCGWCGWRSSTQEGHIDHMCDEHGVCGHDD